MIERRDFSILCSVIILLLMASTAIAADFNKIYAPPLGTRSNARLENATQFGFLYESGEVEKIDRETLGAVFSLQLASEDWIGLEIKTVWRRTAEEFESEEAVTSEGMSKVKNTDTNGSEIVIGLTPKYRFLNLDWVWGQASVELNFPLSARYKETEIIELAPGMQWYFDAVKEWFGVEVDAAYLVNFMVADENEIRPEKEDATNYISGAYARLNLLLKIKRIVYIGATVEDTIWFYTPGDDVRTKALVSHKRPIVTEEDKLDVRYSANHRLNAGGSVTVNLGVFEASVGGWRAVTQADQRQNFGTSLDFRFTFE